MTSKTRKQSPGISKWPGSCFPPNAVPKKCLKRMRSLRPQTRRPWAGVLGEGRQAQCKNVGQDGVILRSDGRADDDIHRRVSEKGIGRKRLLTADRSTQAPRNRPARDGEGLSVGSQARPSLRENKGTHSVCSIVLDSGARLGITSFRDGRPR